VDCLSEAGFQNLVRPTEQTGPESEFFVRRHSFGAHFIGACKKSSRGQGQRPFWTALKTILCPSEFMVNKRVQVALLLGILFLLRSVMTS